MPKQGRASSTQRTATWPPTQTNIGLRAPSIRHSCQQPISSRLSCLFSPGSTQRLGRTSMGKSPLALAFVHTTLLLPSCYAMPMGLPEHGVGQCENLRHSARGDVATETTCATRAEAKAEEERLVQLAIKESLLTGVNMR
eukprot:scaffold157037_cov37-Tisochrysis_lutea.AAC.2